MADISKIRINDSTYFIKDLNALTDAPSNGEEYVRKNGQWAISSGGSGGGGSMSAMYFYEQTVNTGTNAEILRITDQRINSDTIVLECTFADPAYISSDVTWQSYAGYLTFTGTCTAATTANVTLGYTSNDNFSDRLMTLLWENPNPTSSFAAQTISLDLSNYDMVLIESRFHTSSYYDANFSRKIIEVGKRDTLEVLQTPNASSVAYTMYNATRHVITSNSDVYFSDGKYKNVTVSNAAFTSDNSYCIPQKIYGISRYNYFEEKKKKPDLIYSGSPAANSTNNLITGKKFSDYDMLYVVIGGSGNYFNMTIMMDDFVKVNNETRNWWIDNNSNSIWDCNIEWKTDTSFGVGSKGSYVSFMKIYGIL